MNKDGKMHALLATARIANVPSVISNVFTGGVVAWFFAEGIPLSWKMYLAAVLIYVGGNFLNDWKDRKFDAKHRPERALPRGLFSPILYFLIAVGCLFAGLWLVSLVTWQSLLVAIILVGLVLLYTVVHKKVTWSVIPMGLCRACLPVMGFFACWPEFTLALLFPSISLLFYVGALSVSAKNESQVRSHKQRPFALIVLFFSALVAVLPSWLHSMPALVGLLPAMLWLLYTFDSQRKNVGQFVSALLAGIPLIDGSLIFGLTVILVLGGDSIIAMQLLLVPVIAFIFGRLLQRIAPAT